MMMLVDVALGVDQQRELAQRPAIYASPLAFEWRPQARVGHIGGTEWIACTGRSGSLKLRMMSLPLSVLKGSNRADSGGCGALRLAWRPGGGSAA